MLVNAQFVRAGFYCWSIYIFARARLLCWSMLSLLEQDFTVGLFTYLLEQDFYVGLCSVYKSRTCLLVYSMFARAGILCWSVIKSSLLD